MPIGTCGLCRASAVELLDSHFMPSGFYRIARDEERVNPNPVLVNEEVSLVSSEQAKDYFLCAACERRFNETGEDWVLRNCWRDETDFPLRSILFASTPSPLSNEGFTVYEGANIDGVEPDQLAYFGASVFWRGAARDWIFMKRNPKRLHFGPYEEQFRLYLIGEASFPADAVMIVIVSSGMDAMRNLVMVFPFLKRRAEAFYNYRFAMAGLTYQLYLGKGIPNGLRRLCSVRSPDRYIFMVPASDATNIADMATVVAKTRKLGALTRPNPRRRHR